MTKLVETPIKPPVKGLVEVEQLSVSFKSQGRYVSVLESIDLKINPGEFVCLLGPSGCGKSTILNSVAGFIRPNRGYISVDQRLVDQPGADRGFVFQQYSLLPWKTTFQNIEFGLKIRGVPKREREELVHEYLNRVGLYRTHLTSLRVWIKVLPTL